MASRTEGIALLSMYNDEEEEEEEEEEQEPPQAARAEMEVEDDEDQKNTGISMSEVEHRQEHREKTPQAVATQSPPFSDDDLDLKARASSDASMPTPSPPLQVRELSAMVSLRSPSPLPVPSLSSSQGLGTAGPRRRSTMGTLAIVDYGHDDTAMSPEAEEGEIVGTGRVMLAMELQNAEGTLEEKIVNAVQISTPNMQSSPAQPCEQPMVSLSETGRAIDAIERGAEVSLSGVGAEASVEMQEDVDPLNKFLSPPPTMNCPQALQDKINKFLAFKKSGKRFNAEIRKLKEYRNPDFLQHAVTYQGINQTGTCFTKDVFNPQGYEPRDYYDEIEADMRREIEKREQERKRSPKVDFVSGGTQSNMVVPPKINGIPVVGVSVAASGLQSVSADATSRDARPNKKSKWDKVDKDPRNPLHSGGHDSVSTAGAHTTLLSVSTAGAGYTAFAQQKRKEAEERRSSERKFEKRS